MCCRMIKDSIGYCTGTKKNMISADTIHSSGNIEYVIKTYISLTISLKRILAFVKHLLYQTKITK